MEDFKTQARKHCYDTQDLQIAINAMQNLFCLFSVYKKHAFVFSVYNMMVKYALKTKIYKSSSFRRKYVFESVLNKTRMTCLSTPSPSTSHTGV